MLSTNKVGAAIVRHTLKYSPVVHNDSTVPAVFKEAEKAVSSGQLERVKELYKSLLADEEIGA